MIQVRTALRVMPAAWFALPITILAAWYATLMPAPPGYGTAATAAASGALPFIGAFVAATAAWEGSRLRRSGIWGGPWARSRLHIAAGLLSGPVIAGLVATTAAIVVSHAAAAAFPPDLAIVGVITVDILAYASVGFALGILAPSALAVPAAAILPILWLAFVPAMYPIWLRHLTGMYRDCCSLEQSLAPQAVFASVAMNLAFIEIAAVACVTTRPRIWRALGIGAVLTAAVLFSVRVASGLTFAPVMPRDASLLSCESKEGVRVCLWPEHATASAQLLSAITTVRERWIDAGIDAPTTFTEAWGGRATGAIEVHLPDPISNDGVIMALARGRLPPVPDCGRATTGAMAIPYLQAWYAAAGGLSPTALQALDEPGDDVNPSILGAVDQLARAEASVRRAWEAKAAAIGQTCEDIAPDLRVGE